MELFIALVYIIGAVVTSVVLRRRRGIAHHGPVAITGEGGVGIFWFMKATIITAFWPLSAVFALVRSVIRNSAD